MKRTITLFLSVWMAASFLLSGSAAADEFSGAAPVQYLPGVTEAMTRPEFWTARMEEPDRVLASPEEIARVNAAALTVEGSNMHDLKNLPDTFNGIARNESLKRGAAADAEYYLGWTYDETGKKMEQADFDAIIENCADPSASDTMPLRYGIAVDRTLLMTFPYDGMILDDPADLECDYQGLVGVRMNEPVAVYGTSADGKFYQIFSSNCSGWARVEDIALCRDRAEWLSAWDFPESRRLVFWGDKMYTDYSKTAPETSRRLITLGTSLERVTGLDTGGLVINRLPLHNYAVYLPIRNPDGSYGKVAALVNAREKLHEGFLPLTGRNLAAAALSSLGDAYGWGATLNNEDCTSLSRSVFACFGLDLPRNGNWQWPMPMPKADTTNSCREEKELLLDRLPLGTLMNFPGHQMMYLGKVDGAYYVISAAGSIMNPDTGKRQRTRDVQINRTDLKRANGQTWIQAVNRMYLPWKYLEEGGASPMPALPWYHGGVSFCMEKKLMDPVKEGYFQPNEAASRAVIIEALWRTAEKPEPGEGSEGFPDVPEDASYAKAVRWAKEAGVTNGTDGLFLPDGQLSRQQLVAMLYRFMNAENLDGEANLAPFTDAGMISAYARDAMNWAVGNRIIQGKTETTICPQDVLTRAQLAVILQRSYDLYLDSRKNAESTEPVEPVEQTPETADTAAQTTNTTAQTTDTAAQTTNTGAQTEQTPTTTEQAENTAAQTIDPFEQPPETDGAPSAT